MTEVGGSDGGWREWRRLVDRRFVSLYLGGAVRVVRILLGILHGKVAMSVIARRVAGVIYSARS